ncbi:MAG: DedA family protein [Acetobacteraceae bacterium]|nr:DedA family protein [Acetobacteraceae bacterium]
MIEWVTNWVAAGGYAGVFALMFLENLFPPIPSELIMPLAGFAAAQGKLSFAGIMLAGLGGTLLGNAVWYEAARAFGTARTKRLVERYGRWLGILREDLDKAEVTLRRYGPAAVFLGRMMPGIRTVISIPAGLIELPRTVFYLWTLAGSLIWIGALAVLGYVLEDQAAAIGDWIDPIGKVLILAVGVMFLWQLWRIWRRPRP